LRRLVALLIAVAAVFGCASSRVAQPVATVQSLPTESLPERLFEGKVSLECGPACEERFAEEEPELRLFHDRRQWSELARGVAKIGYGSDLAYYYLGRAAEGLNSDANRSYYAKSTASTQKCSGSKFGCGGLDVKQLVARRTGKGVLEQGLCTLQPDHQDSKGQWRPGGYHCDPTPDGRSVLSRQCDLVDAYRRRDGVSVATHLRCRSLDDLGEYQRLVESQDRSASGSASSDASGGPVHVRGYYRSDGTYVRPHTRSRPSRR
jgi:hypothetical protein